MARAKIGLFEAQPVPECRIVIDSYFISELIQYLQVFFNCSRMDVFVSRSDRLPQKQNQRGDISCGRSHWR